MQVKFLNPILLFIVLCNVRNMYKYAFELWAFSIPCTQKEMDKSAIVWHIKLTFSIPVHFDGFYNIYSWFYDKPKFVEKKIIFLIVKLLFLLFQNLENPR